MGCVLGTLVMAVRGTRLVIPAPTFDSLKALEAIGQEESTILFGTPTMFVDMVDNAKQSEYNLNHAGTRGLMAGSICPEQLVRDVNDIFGCRIYIAYGTTENSPVTFMSTVTDSLEQQTTTVGSVMPHTEAKVIDTNDQILQRGETGELCIRGSCTFAGYWNQPEKTKEVLDEEGWYRTGDLAIVTEDGYAKIVGRSKDMIIRGGENIYPAEIEAFLLSHDAIIDAQVIGVPSRRLGEEVMQNIVFPKTE